MYVQIKGIQVFFILVWNFQLLIKPQFFNASVLDK